jgi:hypothetical protein
MWRSLLVVVVAACARRVPDVPPDIRVAEQDVGHRLDGVIIAASGVYIGCERVPDVPAALDKLPDPVDVWLIADREPAWKTVLALRTIAAKRAVRMHRAVKGNEAMCAAKLRVTRRTYDDAEVALSVLITTGEIWVGISRVNEFTPVPRRTNDYDYARLADVLKQQKASAFFVDRNDIELGADPGVTGDAFAQSLDLACRAGFVEIAVLRPDLLTVVPQL